MTWFTMAMHAGPSTSKPEPMPKPKPKPKRSTIHTEKEQRARLSSLRQSFAGNADVKMTVQTLIASHFCPSEKKKHDEVNPTVSSPTPMPMSTMTPISVAVVSP
jgi:hypothetical protein